MKLTPQEEDILAHMRSGKHITPLEALGVYGVFRLGARIFNIKAYLEANKIGETIVTTRVRDSQGKQYARYAIAKVEPRYGVSPVEEENRSIETSEREAEPYVPNFVIVDPLPLKRPLASFGFPCVA
jgi:hypothetical protein